jgi:bacterioferritin
VTLADQVDFLGGVPTVDVPKIANEPDEDAALRLDLKLETDQQVMMGRRVGHGTRATAP